MQKWRNSNCNVDFASVHCAHSGWMGNSLIWESALAMFRIVVWPHIQSNLTFDYIFLFDIPHMDIKYKMFVCEIASSRQQTDANIKN